MIEADTPRGDIVEEAMRLLEAAGAAGLPLRLIGGLAVQMHASGGPHPAVARSYKDIDFVTTKGGEKMDQNLPAATPFDVIGDEDPDTFKFEVVDPKGPAKV